MEFFLPVRRRGESPAIVAKRDDEGRAWRRWPSDLVPQCLVITTACIGELSVYLDICVA